MNSKTVAAIFGVACVGLLLAFVLRHASAVSRQNKDSETIVTYSNQVNTVTEELKGQKAVSLKLQSELTETAKEVVELTTQLSATKT